MSSGCMQPAVLQARVLVGEVQQLSQMPYKLWLADLLTCCSDQFASGLSTGGLLKLPQSLGFTSRGPLK